MKYEGLVDKWKSIFNFQIIPTFPTKIFILIRILAFKSRVLSAFLSVFLVMPLCLHPLAPCCPLQFVHYSSLCLNLLLSFALHTTPILHTFSFSHLAAHL